jgi:predicted DCC family thiol-disulfide oxidoreductase YuxK
VSIANRSPDQQGRPCLLIYDGRCRLCVTAKKGIEQLQSEPLGNNLRMIAYQSEEAKRVLGAGYRPGRPDVAFLVGSDGEVAKGLEAFLPLLPGLKGGSLLALLLRLPGATLVGNLLYQLVACYRYRLFGEVPLEGHPGPAEDESSRPTISP